MRIPLHGGPWDGSAFVMPEDDVWHGRIVNIENTAYVVDRANKMPPKLVYVRSNV